MWKPNQSGIKKTRAIFIEESVKGFLLFDQTLVNCFSLTRKNFHFRGVRIPFVSACPLFESILCVAELINVEKERDFEFRVEPK